MLGPALAAGLRGVGDAEGTLAVSELRPLSEATIDRELMEICRLGQGRTPALNGAHRSPFFRLAFFGWGVVGSRPVF